jgi:hypothetical protein
MTAGLVAFAADAPKAAGPLAAFSGTWSGGGTITPTNGARERIRCRSRNRADDGSLSLSLRCASDSYKFEFASDVTSDGGNISGSWNEMTRGVFGQLAGRISGGRIVATASAIGVSASLMIAAHGNSLSVSIRSPGSEISEVAISLSRSGR